MAGLHPRADLFVKHPPSLFDVVVVLLRQSLSSRLFVSRSILRSLALKILDDVAGGTGWGKIQNTPKILVRLFPHSLDSDVKCHGVIGAKKTTTAPFLETRRIRLY